MAASILDISAAFAGIRSRALNMARARNIKPSIMDNEELAELEPLTRLLFIYLWMLADREGKLEDRPKRIAAQALAYDRNADIPKMLNKLQSSGFIDRYETNGVACIQIKAFAKHQTPHIREAASTLPNIEQGTTKAVPKHDLGNAESSPRSPDTGFLIPDSLIPDSSSLRSESAEASAKTISIKTLVVEGVDKQKATDWLVLRKAKRLPLTPSAWSDTVAEGAKVGLTPAETVAYAVSSNWAGFKASWYTKNTNTPTSSVTVPSKPGIDKTLASLIEEQISGSVKPPSADMRAELARLRKTTAMQ